MDLHGNSRSDTCNKTKQSRMCYVHTGSHINYSLELHKECTVLPLSVCSEEGRITRKKPAIPFSSNLKEMGADKHPNKVSKVWNHAASIFNGGAIFPTKGTRRRHLDRRKQIHCVPSSSPHSQLGNLRSALPLTTFFQYWLTITCLACIRPIMCWVCSKNKTTWALPQAAQYLRCQPLD